MSISTPPTPQTYQNPVYAHDFPDPFILKYGNEYWAYGTGIAHDGRCFGVLHSRDLVTWERLAGAMEPLPGAFPCYWAPEVTYANGVFYLYYSVGDEAMMTIRVATALDPAGPFTDSGNVLTHEPFAIDPHVFQDVDGTRYLFYATDFLEHTHIGTGTVRDRLLDPFTLEGKPRPVTRAKYDWQVYDPQRTEKGGARWHTLEGSFVLRRKGRYYQMFSGGNWQNPTYGVSYATTDDLNTPDEWVQLSDGESVLPILRTHREGGVIGPGHNSVVLAPDNRHYYCVYHRWAADGSGRQMAIDPLEWVGDQMIVLGPSTTPQPTPPAPTLVGFSDSKKWEFRGGEWSVDNEALLQTIATGTAEAHHSVASHFFLLEVWVRAAGDGEAGIQFYDEAGQVAIRVALRPAHQQVTFQVGDFTETFALPANFNAAAFHNIRVEDNGRVVTVSINETAARWQGTLASAVKHFALVTENSAAEFKAFAVTYGWEDLWIERSSLPDLGWQSITPSHKEQWRITDHQLWGDGTQSPAALVKGDLREHYELTINSRFITEQDDGHYAMYPAWTEANSGPALVVAHTNGAFNLQWRDDNGVTSLDLPDNFNPHTYQQFRFVKTATALSVWWETMLLHDTTLPPQPTQIALQVEGTTIVFDMVRVTATN